MHDVDIRCALQQGLHCDVSSNAVDALWVSLTPTDCFSGFETLVVVCETEDMSSREILDWIRPLLQGMSKETWLAAAVEIGETGSVIAWLHSGTTGQRGAQQIYWSSDDAASMLKLVPSTSGLVAVALSDCASQVFTLLDAVADWICIEDAAHPRMIGFHQLFSKFESPFTQKQLTPLVEPAEFDSRPCLAPLSNEDEIGRTEARELYAKNNEPVA